MMQPLTGFAFNPSHKLHKNTININHPENGNRIIMSLNRLKEINAARFYADFTNPQNDEGKLDFDLLDFILKRTHSNKFIQELKNIKNMSQEQINDFCQKYDSVTMTKDSFKVAYESAAYCLTLTQKVATGQLKNAFALVRPPGHHAHNDHAEGFCILNNVAISAQMVIEKKYVEKVLIVDFDIHHGNGTQQFFYSSDKVTYLSIHRYENGNYWPHKRYSDFDYIGSEEGRGHNINIPINENGGTQNDYLYILFTVVIPLARELQPDMIFISAGFDACIGDPVGYMDVLPEVFPHFIYHLTQMCNGKIVCILEGGYNHSAVAVCVDLCLRVLIGEKPPYFKFNKSPRISTINSCMNVLNAIKREWPAIYSYYENAPFQAIAHQTSQPIYNYRSDADSAETGNINQDQLQNLQNTHPAKPIELPKTKLYNINMQCQTYNVQNIPVDPHANQYEDLEAIIDDFAATNNEDIFMSAVYAIRHPENSTTFDNGSENQKKISDDDRVKKRKLPKRTNINPSSASSTSNLPRTSSSTSTSPNNGAPVQSTFQPKKPQKGIIISESKEIEPEPKRFDKLGDLLKITLAHALTKKEWKILVVQWGFSYYCSPFSQRARVVSVVAGEPQDGTATYFPCDLTPEFTDDGLMAVIDRLIIPIGYDLQPHLCILALNLNSVDGKTYGNLDVIRSLIWHMQGLFNHRLLVIVDGKEKDIIGLYTADFLFGKDSDLQGPSRPRQQKDDASIRSVIECIMKNPCPTKDFLRSLVRRII